MKKWFDAEKEATEDIKEGRLSPVFSSAEEGIKYLRSKKGRFLVIKEALLRILKKPISKLTPHENLEFDKAKIAEKHAKDSSFILK